jgi:flagellar biosynthesis/type III secretory pathway M-ring protein FliF/YscJ
MDALKAQLDRLQQQLAGLSASQKMLAASLVAIMVMTLLWWSRYAAQAEMEPVLPQSFTQQELGPIIQQLRAAHIKYALAADGRILVPTDKKDEALSILSYEQVLPANTSTAFDEMLKQLNPFSPASTTEKVLTNAKGRMLADIIRLYPGVYTADVMLNPAAERRVGTGVAVVPTATINILTRKGANPDKRKLAQAAAHAVAGGAGLQKNKISVIIDARTFRVEDDEDGGGGAGSAELFEQQQRVEQVYRDKIQSALSYIPTAIVSVTVDVENRTIVEEKQTVDPDNLVHKPTEEQTRTRENNSLRPGGGEPGIKPNAGLDTTPVPAPDASDSETDETTTTKYQLEVSRSMQKSRTPAGKAKVEAASVSVPRSYLVDIYHQKAREAAAAAGTAAAGPAAKEPDDAALASIEESVLGAVRSIAASNTRLPLDAVFVTTHYDGELATMLGGGGGDSGATGGAAGGDSVVSLAVSRYAREIAIAALAVVSLFMVATMVRKGGGAAPAVAVAAPEPRHPPQLLDAGEEIAGEAGDGDPMLDGMELDEDAVRTEQMLGQVSTMVKENPDAAAALVKRWLNRS